MRKITPWEKLRIPEIYGETFFVCEIKSHPKSVAVNFVGPNSCEMVVDLSSVSEIHSRPLMKQSTRKETYIPAPSNENLSTVSCYPESAWLTEFRFKGGGRSLIVCTTQQKDQLFQIYMSVYQSIG